MNKINSIAYHEGISDYLRFKDSNVPKHYQGEQEKYWRRGVDYAKAQRCDPRVFR